MKPILVGESNPYSQDPDDALLPWPFGCAGWRLCHKVLALREETYLATFDRANLLDRGRWSAPMARASATKLLDDHDVLVLLGRKVCDAFNQGGAVPGHRRVLLVGERERVLVRLPHPSGRSRAWHDPTMERRCRDVLREVLPDIPFGEVK